MFGKKRAQISLFVIVGLVLLIVVALMIFLRNKANEPLDDGSADRIARELQAGVLKDHITSCINSVGGDALEKLGRSGGLIYDYDGGKIPFKPLALGAHYLDYSFQGRKYHVAYGLRENHYCPEINYFTPEYPISGVPFSQFNAQYNSNKECLLHHHSSDYDGFFGSVNLSKLCYSARSSGCESFAEGNIIGFTLQKQLEDYVSTHLPLCVNLSAFSQKMNAEIVQESLPTAEVEIHDSETLLFVRYPVRIIFEDREPVSLVAEYQSRLDVRLGALYNFIYNVLSADSKNIKFNSETQYITLPYWKEGLGVVRLADACKDCSLPYSKDDILEFTDAKSLVNGHPLVFRTAIQDRRPAIDFIPNQSINWDSTPFRQKITAFDPDDSALSYYFISEGLAGGWRETGDEYRRTQTQLNKLPNELVININSDDVGRHRIGVLVIDDSGLFDYQHFWLEVKRTLRPAKSFCISDCTFYSGHGNDYCNPWCVVSNTQCDMDCRGDWWEQLALNPVGCRDCVEAVLGFEEDEPHDDCRKSVYSSYASCSAMMPDCFWVNESKSSEPVNYVESCVNDFQLSSIGVPGSPEFPKYIIIP